MVDARSSWHAVRSFGGRVLVGALGAGLLAATVPVGGIALASSCQAALGVNSLQLQPGASGTLQITATIPQGCPGVDGFQLNVTWDPSVFTIESATAPTGTGWALYPNFNYGTSGTDQIATIAGTQTSVTGLSQGLTGSVGLMDLQITAGSTAGLSTQLAVAPVPGQFETVAGTGADPTSASGTVSTQATATSETVSASQASVTADGTSSAQISAMVKNQTGQPMPGISVNFSSTLGTLAAPTTVDTNLNGVATDTITSTALGQATVTAAVNGITSNNTTSVNFVAGPPATITLEVSPSTPTVGQAVTVSGIVTDANQHPLSGLTVDVMAPGTTTTAAAPTTDANGAYTATLQAPQTPGQASFGAFVNGTSVGTGQTVTVVTVPPATVSSFTASPTSLTSAGGVATLAWQVSNASTCTVTSQPALPGLPTNVDCSSGSGTAQVTLPGTPRTDAATSYAFNLKVNGTNGGASATASATASVSAAVPGQVELPNATIAALQQASGAQVSLTVEPTTQPFAGVWVDIFGPNGHDRSGGPQQVLNAVYHGAYQAVYNAYLQLTGMLAGLPSVQAVTYNVYHAVGVLYNVYLHVIPAGLLTGSGTGTGVGAGSVTPPAPVTGVPGTVSTGSAMVGGLVLPAAKVEVQEEQVAQALKLLPETTSTYTISVPASSIPVGGVVQASVPTQVLQDVAQANKSMEISTPTGSVSLPPATLKQLAQSMGAGAKLHFTIRPAPYTVLQQIQQAQQAQQGQPGQSAQPGQISTPQGALSSAGSPVEIGLEITNANGQTTTLQASGTASFNLTLHYDNQQITGQEALKLGIYRFDTTSGQWVYVGGHTDLTTGVVSTDPNEGIYAVLADNQSFPDIQGYWAQSDIELMVAHHVVNGMTATSFDPTGEVTRAQFAAMIVRALGLNTSVTTSQFSDVPSNAWYAGVVVAAAKAGIVAGYPDGTFRPDANISRQEMAVMIVRAMTAAGQPASILPQQVDSALQPYADRGAVGAWAKEDMAIAVQQDILKGETATTLVPGSNATRAEATVITKRLLGYLGNL